MKGSHYTLVYSIVLGVIVATLLTGAGMLAAPYKEANEKAEKMRTILGVLEIPFNPKAPSADLVELYKKNVREEPMCGTTGYKYLDGEALKAIAVPFEGPGVWGPIHGMLSLEPDLKTIRRVSFYKQEETPGLGGEIATPWFQDQFRKKAIQDEKGVPGVKIRRGKGATAPNEVDGISGATMTGEKVQAMMNERIQKFVKECKK